MRCTGVDNYFLCALVCLATFSSATGCKRGKAGYMIETQSIARKLNAVNVKENLVEWASTQIESHAPAATNRPTTLVFRNVPQWVRMIDGSYSQYEIVYGLDSNDDHVSFEYLTGRDSWGICVGRSTFVPDTNRLPESLFYTVKGDPGLYAWHSRSDY